MTAVPSKEDGNDAIMRPHLFRTAVQYRLGIPLLKEAIPCPLCTQPIQPNGDHATCCANSGDRITRHNALRDMVAGIANQGLLSPVLEKEGVLGATSGRRPGDVTIPNWSGGKGLCIDIAVTSPFAAQNMSEEEPCEHYAKTYKHGKYQKDFEDSDYLFSSIVWETTGAVNTEGEELLRLIMRFASKRLGREHSSFCGRQWARLSCCLQRSVAKMILLRISSANCSNTLARSHTKRSVVEYAADLDTI